MADLPEEFDDGDWLAALEGEFAEVEIPTAPVPSDRVEVACCEEPDCPYNDAKNRFFELGMALASTAYPILAGIGIMRAHGDDIRADFIEAPYRDLIDNYNTLGIAAGYWDEGDDLTDVSEQK